MNGDHFNAIPHGREKNGEIQVLVRIPHCPRPYRDLVATTTVSLESADVTSVKVFELYSFFKAVLA